MCEALRDLMKDEIQEEIQKAQQNAMDAANIAAIRNLKAKQNLNDAEAMDTLGISHAIRLDMHQCCKAERQVLPSCPLCSDLRREDIPWRESGMVGRFFIASETD